MKDTATIILVLRALLGQTCTLEAGGMSYDAHVVGVLSYSQGTGMWFVQNNKGFFKFTPNVVGTISLDGYSMPLICLDRLDN